MLSILYYKPHTSLSLITMGAFTIFSDSRYEHWNVQRMYTYTYAEKCAQICGQEHNVNSKFSADVARCKQTCKQCVSLPEPSEYIPHHIPYKIQKERKEYLKK